MTFNEIETALGQHLGGMTDCPPIAWPNKVFTPNGLYLEFRHSPNERLDQTLGGKFPYQTGLVLVTVVTAKDQFTGEANTVAQSIADRFPKSLRLSAGAGKVLINEPTALAAPFQDGAYWRQPVRIAYITEG